MKKKIFILLLLVAFLFGGSTLSSCNRGTGCPINENAHVKPNKKGEYKKTRTRSGLFPKNMRRHR